MPSKSSGGKRGRSALTSRFIKEDTMENVAAWAIAFKGVLGKLKESADSGRMVALTPEESRVAIEAFQVMRGRPETTARGTQPRRRR